MTELDNIVNELIWKGEAARKIQGDRENWTEYDDIMLNLWIDEELEIREYLER